VDIMAVQKLKVWALYRVSTDRQGAEGDDIPMQESACHSYAEDKGWEITHELSEKLSGYKTNIEDRQALSEIKKGAMNGEFGILLVYHSDRLGRQMEYSLFIANLYELGIQVWSAKEGELGGEQINSFLLSIRYWQLEGESKKTSIRVKDAMAQLNEQGAYMGGSVPYGYKVVDTGIKRNSKKDKTIKKLVRDEKEARVVSLIFSMTCEKNYGSSLIAQELNSMRIDKRGSIWRHNTVTRMLRNPVYMGYKKYNVIESVGRGNKRRATKREEWKLQPFNPELVIVDKQIFKKVQDLLDARYKQSGGSKSKKKAPSAKSQVLLSGLTVCGYCGRNMKTDFSNKKNTRKDGSVQEYRTYRYKCHHSRNGIEPHNQKQYGAVGIDKNVEGEVLEVISSIKLEVFNQEKDAFDFEELDSRRVQLTKLEKQYKETCTALENTEKLFDEIMSGKSTMSMEFISKKLEQYGAKKYGLLTKIDDVKKEIEDAEMTSTDLDKLRHQLENWVEVYTTAIDINKKRQMLSQVLQEVRISKESIVIRFNIAIEKALEGSIEGDNSSAPNDTESNGHPNNLRDNNYAVPTGVGTSKNRSI
jgi:site-specific DNA recombinase